MVEYEIKCRFQHIPFTNLLAEGEKWQQQALALREQLAAAQSRVAADADLFVVPWLAETRGIRSTFQWVENVAARREWSSLAEKNPTSFFFKGSLGD